VIQPTELDTARLRLRQWWETDLPPFAAMNADPAVMRYFPHPLTREASDAMARKLRLLIEERGWGFWAVEIRGGDPFIGFVGLRVPSSALPFSPCVEIGWRLGAAHWGHGYATEAALAALSFAFDQLLVTEVVAFTAIENWPSRRVMVRLGMKESMEFDHPDVPTGNPVRKHVLYRLVPDRLASEGVR
jgi:RimJ/RimL family protein N-acetyltransferase